jgi:hypothetical protein
MISRPALADDRESQQIAAKSRVSRVDLETGAARHSDAAVEALSVYERNSRLSERVKQALENRRTLHS